MSSESDGGPLLDDGFAELRFRTRKTPAVRKSLRTDSIYIYNMSRATLLAEGYVM